MKRILFFTLLSILAVFIFNYSQEFIAESFQNSKPSVNIPKIKPAVVPLGEGDPQPFTPPSTALLSPPPGQTASVNSYPVKDPARKPVNIKRIKSVYETIKGFIKNELGGIEHSGDPSVQLPLESLKADYRRLEDENFILTKNPGVESTLTEDDIKGMSTNLHHLQNKWRLSANTSVEGFQGWFNPTQATDPTSTGPVGGTSNNFGVFPPNPAAPASQAGPGIDTTASPASTDPSSTNPTSSSPPPASMYELNDLVLRISAEILRLNASGTTDPVVSQRVDILTKIQTSVTDIINQVKSGQIPESQIPILESSYYAFLPVMSKLDSALPTLISNSNMSSSVNNLFPIYGAGDISGANLARSIFEKYAGDFMKNISWNLNLNYTGDAESKMAEEVAKGLAATAIGKTSRGDDEEGPYSKAPKTGYRGMFDSMVQKGMMDSKDPTATTATTAAIDTSIPGPPVKLDWKKRAADICEQAKRRGLNPYEFGCMKDTSAVSETFSFRGYAKMICNRLSTNYDPGVPELCGCPPATWHGWRG